MITRVNKRLFFEKPIPGRAKAYRSDIGGYGIEIELEGLIHEPNPYLREQKKKQLSELADGQVKTFWEGQSNTSLSVIVSEVNFEKVADDPFAIRYRIRMHEVDNP
jgi:hypothetical protein